MSFTKAQLLADLAIQYKFVGIPEAQPTTTIVTPYVINILEAGASEANKKPTAYQKNILFYVYDEGGVGEEAYYGRVEPTNTSNSDVSCILADVELFSSYEKIYNSVELRKRIIGWLLKISGVIISEAESVPHHSMRLKWANDVVKDPTKYVNICMCYISQSSDVKVLGAACSDNDLSWLGYMVNNIATIYGFTD